MLSGAFAVASVDGGISLETDGVIRSFTYTDGAEALRKGLLLNVTARSAARRPTATAPSIA